MEKPRGFLIGEAQIGGVHNQALEMARYAVLDSGQKFLIPVTTKTCNFFPRQDLVLPN